jgi:hypothetical protein
MSRSELRRSLEVERGVLRHVAIGIEQAGEFVLTSTRRRPVSKAFFGTPTMPRRGAQKVGGTSRPHPGGRCASSGTLR